MWVLWGAMACLLAALLVVTSYGALPVMGALWLLVCLSVFSVMLLVRPLRTPIKFPSHPASSYKRPHRHKKADQGVTVDAGSIDLDGSHGGFSDIGGSDGGGGGD